MYSKYVFHEHVKYKYKLLGKFKFDASQTASVEKG